MFSMAKRVLITQKSLAVILVISGLFISQHSAAETTCKTDDRLNEIINIQETKKAIGDGVRVLKGIKLDNSEDCKEECCSNPNCTLYVSYSKPNATPDDPNCFVISCVPEEDCVFSSLSGSILGVRVPNDGEYLMEMVSINRQNYAVLNLYRRSVVFMIDINHMNCTLLFLLLKIYRAIIN